MKKHSWMVLILAIFLISCAGKTSLTENTAVQTGNQAELAITPLEPVSLQSTTLEIKLTSSQDTPIAGAVISLDLSMPAMTMPKNNPSVTESGNGLYQAEAVFTMPGEWLIRAEIKTGTGIEVFDFPVTVK